MTEYYALAAMTPSRLDNDGEGDSWWHVTTDLLAAGSLSGTLCELSIL
jgi:hypothetical protein